MSAFAALQGFDGDADIVKEGKKKLAREASQREAEVQRSKIKFDELRKNIGSNWADEDSEEEDMFAVKVAACLRTRHSSRPPACPAGLDCRSPCRSPVALYKLTQHASRPTCGCHMPAG